MGDVITNAPFGYKLRAVTAGGTRLYVKRGSTEAPLDADDFLLRQLQHRRLQIEHYHKTGDWLPNLEEPPF